MPELTTHIVETRKTYRPHPKNNGSCCELDCEFGKFKSNPGIQVLSTPLASYQSKLEAGILTSEAFEALLGGSSLLCCYTSEAFESLQETRAHSLDNLLGRQKNLH